MTTLEHIRSLHDDAWLLYIREYSSRVFSGHKNPSDEEIIARDKEQHYRRILHSLGEPIALG